MKLDLHGLTVEDATREVLIALLSLDMDTFENELEIITGKGLGFLLNATLNLLDEEQRNYRVLEHRIIVYKNEKNDDYDFHNLMSEIMDDD